MKLVISKVMSDMIRYFGNDVKRINHALKVYGFASSIAILENLTKPLCDIVEIAAILHDIGIKESERKYCSSAGKYQEIEGPPIARRMLESYQVEKGMVDRICYLIGNHHSYEKIDGIDFQVLVEADFLVNIYEDSIGHPQMETLRAKYFKTQTGTAYFNEMYEASKSIF